MSRNIMDLLEKAADYYNQGAYDRAIETWNQVLATDPENQKANEGIRMASLLRSSEATSRSAREREARENSFTDRIQAIKGRVRELVEEGKHEDAREGCTLLEDLAPEDPDVLALCDSVRSTMPPVEAAGFPASEAASSRNAASEAPMTPRGVSAANTLTGPAAWLADARAALEEGRLEAAAKAAEKVLKIEPSNMEAAGILSMTGASPGSAAAGGAVSVGSPAPREAARKAGPSASADDMIPLDPIPLEAIPSPAAAGPGEEGVFESHRVSDASPAERVARLLKDGKRAFDAGRPQEAIEIWSRVFVLDESNVEASEGIDQARAILDEQGRQVEDLMHQACDARDEGRLDEALELFQKVRAMSPMHAEAGAAIEELMERLAGEATPIDLDLDAVAAVPEFDAGLEDPIGPPDSAAISHAPSHEINEIPLDLEPEPAPRHAPGATRAPSARPVPPTTKVPLGRAARVFLTFSGAVFVLIVALWAWIWFGFGGTMPEAQATIPHDESAAPAPSAPASAPPATGKSTPPEPSPENVDPADAREQSRAHARAGEKAYRAGDWPAAVQELLEARRLDPLFPHQDMLTDAMNRLEDQAEFEQDMDAATQFFVEGDYASSLHKLYRLQQKFGRKRPFDVYIRNAWFNWGVLLMQAGSVDEAIEKFNEVLDLNRSDRVATRAREVATRYQERPRDLAYDTYVDALPTRGMEQR